FLSLVELDYVDGSSRTMFFPTAVLSDERVGQLRHQHPLVPIVRLTGNLEGLVVDGMHAPECAELIVRIIAGPVTATPSGAEIADPLLGPIDWRAPVDGSPAHSSTAIEEPTSATVVLADQLRLKVLRQVEPGLHPEVEIGRYLTHHSGFEHVAAL